MAEFCFECFCKLIADTNDFPIVGEKKDLCEGCGQVKPVVVTTIPKPVRVRMDILSAVISLMIGDGLFGFTESL